MSFNRSGGTEPDMSNSDYTVIENAFGCDYVVKIPRERKGDRIKVLQLTDPQLIDMSQEVDPLLLPKEGYFSESRMKAWAPENFDRQCGNHIRSLIAQTAPDFIFITGDIVYGRYDNDGSALKWLSDLFDTFSIQ